MEDTRQFFWMASAASSERGAFLLSTHNAKFPALKYSMAPASVRTATQLPTAGPSDSSHLRYWYEVMLFALS